MESTNRAAQIINAPVADVNGGDASENKAAVDCNRADVGVTAATASLDDRETSSNVAGETINASPAEMDLPDGGLNGVAAGLSVRPVAAVCDRWL